MPDISRHTRTYSVMLAQVSVAPLSQSCSRPHGAQAAHVSVSELLQHFMQICTRACELHPPKHVLGRGKMQMRMGAPP